MTFDNVLVLAILGGAVVLFVSERLRVDVVALLVLAVLAITGLVTPREAVSGFGHPAVITIWAVFVLSGALARTGVASVLGEQVLRLAGDGEARLVAVIMLTAGSLSAFMNNVGVAALLLPVVMDIARRTGRAPSRLLMPLASSCLLGGLTTLIGTPPNLLISEALREAGLEPFRFFDFLPVGASVLVAGTLFMSLWGRRLLPQRELAPRAGAPDLGEIYRLRERLFVLHVPRSSVLVGKALAESRLGTLLGLNVLGILRAGRARLAPQPETVLAAGDRLLVEGRAEELSQLAGGPRLTLEGTPVAVDELVSAGMRLAEVALAPGSSLAGRTLHQSDFRRRFGVNVVAIWRAGRVQRSDLPSLALQPDDVLVVQGTGEQIERLIASDDFVVRGEGVMAVEKLEERLLVASIPADSPLAGQRLADSRLGEAYGLNVLGIVRDGRTLLVPGPDEPLRSGDTLLVEGRRSDLETLEGLHSLEVDAQELIAVDHLQSERVGLAEVVLAPRSSLVGKTLVDLRFRERYGLSVVALSREGTVHHRRLRQIPLRFGDALLVHGPRARIELLASDPDFLVLEGAAQPPPRTGRAPLAAAVMVAVVVTVLVGWLPIYIAALAGAVITVLGGCQSMDEAYRAIEWRAVFLIAGMMPLGIALEQTGTAHLLTQGVVAALGGLDGLAVIAVVFLLTALAAQVMPTAAVAILLAPIALETAHELGYSPRALLMTVALSASASFMSPVSHPANVLIMGPGGYRFTDYLKIGLPLTLVCLVVVLVLLPLVWPLT